jgi:hypothetical protein
MIVVSSKKLYAFGDIEAQVIILAIGLTIITLLWSYRQGLAHIHNRAGHVKLGNTVMCTTYGTGSCISFRPIFALLIPVESPVILANRLQSAAQPVPCPYLFEVNAKGNKAPPLSVVLVEAALNEGDLPLNPSALSVY